jgi:hypothetical protein
MKDFASIGAKVSSLLPAAFEPLLLTFYGANVRRAKGRVAIGNDYGTELCLNPEDDSIWSIDFEGKLPNRFVNSSLEQLAHFIREYAKYTEEVFSLDDEAASKLVRNLRKRLASADAGAFLDTENWWAVVFEQAEQGLL